MGILFSLRDWADAIGEGKRQNEKEFTLPSLKESFEQIKQDLQQQSFRQLDEKKVAESRELKHTNDLGEIHSIAAAVLLNAGIICSNDLDIREVIADSEVLITEDEETESILLTQDTLEDFCFYVIIYEIAKRKIARTFFKTIHPDKVDILD